jgi:hypothetical protein
MSQAHILADEQGQPMEAIPTRLDGGDELVTNAGGVPRSLAPCFQEYNFEIIDPDRHGDLVIERVLTYGDRQEVRWLLGRLGRSRVVDWVQRLGARRLPWRRYNLWCVVFGLGEARHPRPPEERVWPH